MKFAVCLEGMIIANSDDEVESHLDAVMAEFLKLNAEDPSVDVNLSERRVTLRVAVDATNPVDAVASASGCIRSAIHAAGGATPDWPALQDGSWVIRLIGVRSGELVDA